MLVGWCRPRRRLRRRRGSTIWLGNKRRGFGLGSRPALQWGAVVSPIRMLKKMFMEMLLSTATSFSLVFHFFLLKSVRSGQQQKAPLY
ncbi:unnamed protein product [Prunus armeniaca]